MHQLRYPDPASSNLLSHVDKNLDVTVLVLDQRLESLVGNFVHGNLLCDHVCGLDLASRDGLDDLLEITMDVRSNWTEKLANSK